MRRWLIALCAALVATTLAATPLSAGSADRLNDLLTGEASGTTSFDGIGCPQIHHYFRGAFESGTGRLDGSLDVDFCVTLVDLFPASGTFSLVTTRGTLAGTATTLILDPASVFTLVVTSGTRSFSNVSGTIEVDLVGPISAFDAWEADVSADLARVRTR